MELLHLAGTTAVAMFETAPMTLSATKNNFWSFHQQLQHTVAVLKHTTNANEFATKKKKKQEHLSINAANRETKASGAQKC